MAGKKVFVFTVLFIAALLTAKAQRFNSGIVLGLNASQIDGDTIGGYNKAGLVLGTYVSTNFTNKISGKLELRYSGKGSATDKDELYNIRKYRLQYIEFPVTMGYKFNQVLKGEFGLSPGVLFKAEYYNSGWYDLTQPSKFDLQYSLGADYQLFEHISVNARFSYSILSILEGNHRRLWFEPSSWFSYAGAWHNNVITFSFYYNFLGNSY